MIKDLIVFKNGCDEFAGIDPDVTCVFYYQCEKGVPNRYWFSSKEETAQKIILLNKQRFILEHNTIKSKGNIWTFINNKEAQKIYRMVSK